MAKWVLFALALPGLAVVIWLGRMVPDPIKPEDVPQALRVVDKNFSFHHSRHTPWGDVWTWMGPGGSENPGPNESGWMLGVLPRRGKPAKAIDFIIDKSEKVEEFSLGHREDEAACSTYKDRRARVIAWFVAARSDRGTCVISLTGERERSDRRSPEEACADAGAVYDELDTALTAICPE